MDGNPYLDSPAVERLDAIMQLHAAECAIRRTLLQIVAAHDEQESWKEDGAASMTGWLVAQLGVAHGTAAQLVSVAETLERLPAVAAGLEQGLLSWDKTRALARFATPETETELTEEARGLSASQMHTLARRMRTPDDKARRTRSVRKWWDADREWLHIHGRIPGAEAATVEKALDRAVQRVPQNADHQVCEDHEARLADALVEIAAGSLAADPDPDRASVVVHLDLQALTNGTGVAEIESGPALTTQTAQRLCCDARLQTVLDGADGLPIGIGRTSRTIPAWLNRQIRHRDRTCRFPGCERTSWVHAHHLVHWSKGGPTDLDNLVLLCPYHHRLVHEGGWRIEGSPNGDLVFIRPDGRPYQPRPQPLQSEVRQRLVEPVVAVAAVHNT